METVAALCDFAPGWLLVFGPNVGPLQYYSHLPTIVISSVLAVFILMQNRKGLPNQTLFVTIFSFVLWVLFDSVIWATNRSDVIMFMWSLQVLIEPLVYVGALFFLYALIDRKPPSFKIIALWVVLYLPLILLVPTKYVLSGFDLAICLANETYISYYSYVLELFFVIWILVFSISRFIHAGSSRDRQEITALTVGVILLLIAFAWGNITGSFTEDWQLAQYGLFGMPIFTAFLVYSIVKFGTFNTKLIGAVALIFGLWALNFSLLFVEDVTVFRGVAIVTLLVSVFFGFFLMRSVHREIRQREIIQVQAQYLEKLNHQQEGLLAFISHEVKGYLAKSQAAFAGIVQGDYGTTTPQLKAMADTGLIDMRKGVDMVADILDASNLRKGTVAYEKKPFDFKHEVDEVIHDLKATAERKGLELHFSAAAGDYRLIGDEAKMRRHVIRNLIDNSIHYTQAGSITVSLSRNNSSIHFSVKDTGVGITKEDMQNLFTEGGRGKESVRVNADSTGYGLFIAKQVTEAHGGTIWAESKGKGTGSEFIVELPIA